MEYLYCGTIIIDDKNVCNLAMKSDYLLLDELKGKCEQFMLHQIEAVNCIDFDKFAQIYGLNKLRQYAKKTMLKEFNIVISMDEFKQMPFNKLIEYISDDRVNVENEDAVLNAVVLWIKHDTKQRQANFMNILKHVRLPFCTERLFTITRIFYKYSIEEFIYHYQKCSSRMVAWYSYSDLVIFGGIILSGKSTTNCQSTYIYDKKKAQWQKLALPEKDDRLYSACMQKSNIIMTGGSNSFGQCMMYNMVNRKSKEMPSLNTKRFRHSSVVHGDNVYVFGGQIDDPNHFNEYMPIASVERFNVRWHQWSAVPDMPQPVLFPVVAIYNDIIYVFGGVGGDKEAVSHTWKYDPVKEVWNTLADMPQCSPHSAVVVLNNFIYVVGGYTPLCLRYDPSMNTWAYRSSPLHPHGAGAAVVWQGRILLAGGKKFKDEFTSISAFIEEYDAENDMWSTWETKLPEPLAHHTLHNVESNIIHPYKTTLCSNFM